MDEYFLKNTDVYTSSRTVDFLIFLIHTTFQSTITGITPQQAVEHSLRFAGLFNLKIPLRFAFAI
jgi:hypothetical protein